MRNSNGSLRHRSHSSSKRNRTICSAPDIHETLVKETFKFPLAVEVSVRAWRAQRRRSPCGVLSADALPVGVKDAKTRQPQWRIHRAASAAVSAHATNSAPAVPTLKILTQRLRLSVAQLQLRWVDAGGQQRKPKTQRRWLLSAAVSPPGDAAAATAPSSYARFFVLMLATERQRDSASSATPRGRCYRRVSNGNRCCGGPEQLSSPV